MNTTDWNVKHLDERYGLKDVVVKEGEPVDGRATMLYTITTSNVLERDSVYQLGSLNRMKILSFVESSMDFPKDGQQVFNILCFNKPRLM